jgi:hypothetical protein
MPEPANSSRPREGSPRSLLATDTYLALLYFGLGLAIAFVWQRIVDRHGLPSWHLDMISGHAPAPNQYRPLTPFLAEAVRRLLPDQDLETAYLVLRGALTGVTLVAFERYLRVWFLPAAAAAGTLLLAAIIPFTFMQVVQESDPLNLLIFVLAYWALAVGRDLWLIPLVVVGTLNRETIAMIPVAYLVVRYGWEPCTRVLARAAILGTCWASTYGGLLLHYGRRAYYCDAVMFSHNVGSLSPTLFPLLLFGPVWGMAVLARRDAPAMLRRSLWLVPPFILLHYVVAVVEEVRLFLPLAPILIPLAWFRLFPEDRLPVVGTPG